MYYSRDMIQYYAPKIIIVNVFVCVSRDRVITPPPTAAARNVLAVVGCLLLPPQG